MIKGDAVYNKNFCNMVREAIICGLGHPIEWLIGYQRGIGVPDSFQAEINEFANIAWSDLFEMCNGHHPANEEDIQEWVDMHYKIKE